jgi:hypothetical protein
MGVREGSVGTRAQQRVRHDHRRPIGDAIEHVDKWSQMALVCNEIPELTDNESARMDDFNLLAFDCIYEFQD